MKTNPILKSAALGALALCVALPLALRAGSASVSLPAGETLSSDYINAQETVDVASDVTGDVILAGANVSFSGRAGGDILIAGGNVRVAGDTAGSVRVLGGNVTLSGQVAKNLTVVGGSVIVEEGSQVAGNLYVAGGNVELRGQVAGRGAAYASQLSFSGRVQGDADLRSANKIIVRPDARVGGNLTFASGEEPENLPQVVAGSVTRVPLDEYMTQAKQEQQKTAGALFLVVVWQFLSLLVAGYVLHKLFGRQSLALTTSIRRQEVWNRIAYGLLSLVFNPIVIVLTAFTLIGLPLALMILLVYIIFLIAAAALSPVLAGKLLNSRLRLYAPDGQHLFADFLLGFVLIQLVGLVPVLGPLATTALFLFSFGRLTRFVTDAVKANR